MAKEITKITKFWPISKIMDIYPDSVEYMMEIGLSCFSCSANTEERLNEGMKLHGFSDAEIDQLIEKINTGFQTYRETKMKIPTEADFNLEIIQEANTKYYRLAGLMFTETAYDALHELLDEFKGLQIRLDAGGCSGYSYTYDFKNAPEEDEKTFTLSEKLELYMNDFTFNKLHSSIVDFKFGIKDAGLKFINPNIKDACHCGTSVGF